MRMHRAPSDLIFWASSFQLGQSLCFIIKPTVGIVEMGQWLRALPTPAKDLIQFPAPVSGGSLV